MQKALISICIVAFVEWRKPEELSQVPIIIPLVVAGALLGSAWPSENLLAAWKKAVLAAILSGVLNMGHIFVLGILRIPAGNLPANSNVSLATSGFTGFVVVLAVYLSAIVMVRYRRGKTLESEE